MRPRTSPWILATALLASPARAAGCDPPAKISLLPENRTTEITGAVPRGLRDCYRFPARKGERLSVAQRADAESAIVFQLYRPPWRIRHEASGLEIQGQPLPGAREGEDARSWRGTLPVSGTYLLVIGTTRGGGPYAVSLKLR